MAAMTSNESRSLVLLSRTPDHPPFGQMVSEAITALDEEAGSSESSISKYIVSNHRDLPPAHDSLLHYHLSKLTRLGEILQLSPGLYTLPYFQNPNPLHGRSSKLPRSTEPSEKKHRMVDSDPGFDAEERGSAPVRKRRGRPPKAKPAGHEKNGGPALDAGGGEVRLLPPEGALEGGDGLIRRRRGRPPKAKIRKDGDGVLRLEDLEGRNSVGDKVVQDGDVAGQANAAMQISTSLDSRDEAKGNALELSKRVTSDEDKSLLPQKKSKKEATEGISSPTAFQEVTSGGETLREMLSQYQSSDSPNTQVRLRGKMLAHRRNPSLINSRTKQWQAITEGDLKVHKNHEVRKPKEQLGNVGDEQLNEELHAPQTEPVTPVGLWDKDLQTQEMTSVIRSEEISNEATQNKGDEIIHEEQQKSPHQSSHDKVTMPEEQLGNVGDEQLNEKLHAPQTEPVTPIALWDKDLQAQERTSVTRLEEISNEAAENKGDEIIHEEKQKSPHQSSRDYDEQRKVKKANAVNPSSKELSPLPFVKISPMWKMMESNVLFNTIPQCPHFQPLEQCSEVFREGMAIGHMLSFANVAGAICKLHLGDHRSAFENMLKDLAELERQGFDGQLLRVRFEQLLWLKDSFLQSEDKLVETELHMRGQRHQKDNLNTEIDTLNRDIAILQEKRMSVIETRKKTEENIEQLQQEVQNAKEASCLAQEDFKKAAAAPWSA